MKSRTARVLLLAVAVAGCRDSGSAPEQSPGKTAPKINIRFDLTEYRKLANAADDVTVGIIEGTRTRQLKNSTETVTDLAVKVRPADGPEQVELFRTHTKATTELLKHKGEEYLFFWKDAAFGKENRGREVIACFPLDKKHKKILTWLKGGAKQYTLFDPTAKNELPTGLEASSHIVREDGFQSLRIRFTNRRKETLVLAPDVILWRPLTRTSLTGFEGAVVWPSWQTLVTNAPIEDGLPYISDKYVTLAPRESMDIRACSFAIIGQELDAKSRSPEVRLAGGKYHFRFTYDSTGCKTWEGETPLKARMVVYGSFEAKP